MAVGKKMSPDYVADASEALDQVMDVLSEYEDSITLDVAISMIISYSVGSEWTVPEFNKFSEFLKIIFKDSCSSTCRECKKKEKPDAAS